MLLKNNDFLHVINHVTILQLQYSNIAIHVLHSLSSYEFLSFFWENVTNKLQFERVKEPKQQQQQHTHARTHTRTHARAESKKVLVRTRRN